MPAILDLFVLMLASSKIYVSTIIHNVVIPMHNIKNDISIRKKKNKYQGCTDIRQGIPLPGQILAFVSLSVSGQSIFTLCIFYCIWQEKF